MQGEYEASKGLASEDCVETSLRPRPFFAGEEKRPGTISLIIPRKVGIPDISGLYSHT